MFTTYFQIFLRVQNRPEISHLGTYMSMLRSGESAGFVFFGIRAKGNNFQCPQHHRPPVPHFRIDTLHVFDPYRILPLTPLSAVAPALGPWLIQPYRATGSFSPTKVVLMLVMLTPRLRSCSSPSISPNIPPTLRSPKSCWARFPAVSTTSWLTSFLVSMASMLTASSRKWCSIPCQIRLMS